MTLRGGRVGKEPQMNPTLPETTDVELSVGVSSNSIIYRYSYEWLFDLMAEEEVRYLQLGTFFELYSLPDEYFLRLKEKAGERGIFISSIFSTFRELGGLMSEDPALRNVTEENYRRLIEVAVLVGSPSAGASMGGVMRDRLEYRTQGIRMYIQGMKELMHYAHQCGLEWLTTEPMSCYAEPPCTAQELVMIGEALAGYHHTHPSTTAGFGYCSDISHGWVDEKKHIIEDNLTYFQASFPYLYEFHFKNTDDIYNKTFGFEPENRDQGIIDVGQIRDLLVNGRHRLSRQHIIGYLEHPGPKLGRDYSDAQLGRLLRESLRHIKSEFLSKKRSCFPCS